MTNKPDPALPVELPKSEPLCLCTRDFGVHAAHCPAAAPVRSGDPLREALECAIQWEEEYRRINHLGKVAPHWVGMAQAALASRASSEPQSVCKWCDESTTNLEWSIDANCWIHRRPSLDKACLKPKAVAAANAWLKEQFGRDGDYIVIRIDVLGHHQIVGGGLPKPAAEVLVDYPRAEAEVRAGAPPHHYRCTCQQCDASSRQAASPEGEQAAIYKAFIELVDEYHDSDPPNDVCHICKLRKQAEAFIKTASPAPAHQSKEGGE